VVGLPQAAERSFDQLQRIVMGGQRWHCGLHIFRRDVGDIDRAPHRDGLCWRSPRRVTAEAGAMLVASRVYQC
jgi:hypothetical protein